jgi:hypothetical protein
VVAIVSNFSTKLVCKSTNNFQTSKRNLQKVKVYHGSYPQIDAIGLEKWELGGVDKPSQSRVRGATPLYL